MIDPLCDTPSAITKSLAEVGEPNPFGKPMWRVVLAHNHTRKKRGIWHEFADGTIEQFKIEDGKMRYNPLHATRVVDEVRDTPLFPVKGWILERWFAKENWPDDGQHEQGDYWMLGGPWDELPEIGDLKDAIAVWLQDWEKRPRSYEQAYRLFIAEEEDQKRKQEEKLEEEFNAFYRGEIKPIFNTISLGAQAVRNECQKALGESSHLGAGQ